MRRQGDLMIYAASYDTTTNVDSWTLTPRQKVAVFCSVANAERLGELRCDDRPLLRLNTY